MCWINKYHKGFNRLWLVFSIVGAFAFVCLNALMGGYEVLNRSFIPERTKAKMTEAEKQQNKEGENDWVPTEKLDLYARNIIESSPPYILYIEAIKFVHPEDRDTFRRLLYGQRDKRQKTKVWQARGRFVRDLLGAFIVTFAIGHGVFLVVWWIIQGFR